MTGRVHVVVGSPWRDAVVKHLEPRSTYRPWPHVPDVREGDGVLVVFDTAPRLALTQLARVGADRDVEAAIAALHREWLFTNAVHLSRFGVEITGRYAVIDDSSRLAHAVEEHRFNAPREDKFGHSSMAAARVLLESDGRCTGCAAVLDLVSSIPAVRTVDSPEDWPAVLCAACRTAMHDSGFTTFLDYRFSLHPACPRCEACRTQGISFGMPVAMDETAPWVNQRGCCVTDEEWVCSRCHHEW